MRPQLGMMYLLLLWKITNVYGITVSPTNPVKNQPMTITATASGTSITWTKGSTILTSCIVSAEFCNNPSALQGATITMNSSTSISEIAILNANELVHGGIYEATGLPAITVIVNSPVTSISWITSPSTDLKTETDVLLEASVPCVYPPEKVKVTFEVYQEDGIYTSIELQYGTDVVSYSDNNCLSFEVSLNASRYVLIEKQKVQFRPVAEHTALPSIAPVNGSLTAFVTFQGLSVTTMEVTTVVTQQSSTNSQSLSTTYPFTFEEPTTTPTSQPTTRFQSVSVSHSQTLQPNSAQELTDITLNLSHSFETTTVTKPTKAVPNKYNHISNAERTIIIIFSISSVFALIIALVFIFAYCCKEKNICVKQANNKRNVVIRKKDKKCLKTSEDISVRNTNNQESFRITQLSSHSLYKGFTSYQGNTSRKINNFRMAKTLNTRKYCHDDRFNPSIMEDNTCDYFNSLNQEHPDNYDLRNNYSNRQSRYPDMKSKPYFHDWHYSLEYQYPYRLHNKYQRSFCPDHTTLDMHQFPSEMNENYHFYHGKRGEIK